MIFIEPNLSEDTTGINRYCLHESVFELAGKELTNNYRERPACDLLFEVVLINVRFKRELAGHIIYTTQQIMNAVKAEGGFPLIFNSKIVHFS